MEVGLEQGVFQAIKYAIWLRVKVGNVNKFVSHKVKKILVYWCPIFHCVATLALGSRPSPRQGLTRLRAKREARGSHVMLPGV